MKIQEDFVLFLEIIRRLFHLIIFLLGLPEILPHYYWMRSF